MYRKEKRVSRSVIKEENSTHSGKSLDREDTKLPDIRKPKGGKSPKKGSKNQRGRKRQLNTMGTSNSNSIKDLKGFESGPQYCMFILVY